MKKLLKTAGKWFRVWTQNCCVLICLQNFPPKTKQLPFGGWINVTSCRYPRFHNSPAMHPKAWKNFKGPISWKLHEVTFGVLNYVTKYRKKICIQKTHWKCLWWFSCISLSGISTQLAPSAHGKGPRGGGRFSCSCSINAASSTCRALRGGSQAVGQ